MIAERVALMPHWPARMDDDFAALYLGVSVTTFRERVKDRKYPQPVREGRRLLWGRRQLDHFVDAQFGMPQPDDENQGDASWGDLR